MTSASNCVYLNYSTTTQRGTKLVRAFCVKSKLMVRSSYRNRGAPKTNFINEQKGVHKRNRNFAIVFTHSDQFTTEILYVSVKM